MTEPDAPPTLDALIEPLLGWLTRQRTEVDLELACAEHPRPGRGLERHTIARLPGCLADLPDHAFLELGEVPG